MQWEIETEALEVTSGGVCGRSAKQFLPQSAAPNAYAKRLDARQTQLHRENSSTRDSVQAVDCEQAIPNVASVW